MTPLLEAEQSEQVEGSPEPVGGEPVGAELTPAVTVEETAPEAAIDDAGALAGQEPEEGQQETAPENPFDFDLEEAPVTAPQELSAALEADPAARAAIEANPELRNRLFANARLAARAQEYGQVFASPDDARIAAQGHGVYSSVREALGGIKRINEAGGPESTQAALKAFFDATIVHDENGNPVIDQRTGQPVTDGTFGRLLTNATASRMLALRAEAVKAGDENTQAAVDILMERMGVAPSRPAEEDGDSPLAAERAALQAERAALDQDKAKQQQATQQAFEERIERAGDQLVDQAMNSILDRVENLSKLERSALDGELRKRTTEAIRKDPFFAQEFNRLQSLPPSAKVEKERVALVSKYLQKHVPLIAKPALEESGLNFIAKQAKRNTTSTARRTAAQSEVRGSASATSRPTGPMTGAQLNALATEQLARELGTSRPPMSAVITRVAQLRAGAGR